MRRLVDDWSLDDPNPEAYRKVLENMSTSKSASDTAAGNAVPTECEPERMVQIAIEVGAMGPQVLSAMAGLCKAGRAAVLLDLVERAPDAQAVAPVWEFLVGARVLDALLEQQRVDLPLVGRFARRMGMAAVPSLIDAGIVYEDAKIRTQFYEVVQSLGDGIGAAVAERIPKAPPIVQRELLAFLGRLDALPPNFSASDYVLNQEALVRREAIRLLLRDNSSRDGAVMTALFDEDDRVVFVGLSAAQEKCPPGAVDLIKHRVGRGELDSQLRTMGIRIVAQQRPRRPSSGSSALWWVRPGGRAARSLPSTRRMLAALGVLTAGWGDDPAAATAISLAAGSREPDVRAKVAGKRASESKGAMPA